MVKKTTKAKRQYSIATNDISVGQTMTCCGVGEIGDIANIRWYQSTGKHDDYDYNYDYNSDKVLRQISVTEAAKLMLLELSYAFVQYPLLVVYIPDNTFIYRKYKRIFNRCGFVTKAKSKSKHGNYQNHLMILSKEAFTKACKRLKLTIKKPKYKSYAM